MCYLSDSFTSATKSFYTSLSSLARLSGRAADAHEHQAELRLAVK